MCTCALYDIEASNSTLKANSNIAVARGRLLSCQLVLTTTSACYIVYALVLVCNVLSVRGIVYTLLYEIYFVIK